MKSPTEIISLMMEGDAYSRNLGMEVLHIAAGQCTLRMQVTGSMVNGFNIAHGGIAYALADSAMAFASNAHGLQCVSIESGISHIKKVQIHDELIATALELSRTKRMGRYAVEVKNQQHELVAHFKGSVLVSEILW